MSEETLSNLSREERRFEPPAELVEHANVHADAYDRAPSDHQAFWAEQAERLGDGIVETLRKHVQEIGAIAEHREVGDVTTLADSSVMNLISQGLSSDKAED